MSQSPDPVPVTSEGKRDSAGMIKERVLRWERNHLSGDLSKSSQVSQKKEAGEVTTKARVAVT